MKANQGRLAALQITQIPWLDKVMGKNRVADTLQQVFHRTASLSILGFISNAIEEKIEKLAKGEIKSEGK